MQSTSIPLGDHNPKGHTSAEVIAALTGRPIWAEYVEGEETAGMGAILVDQGEQAWLELVTSVDHTLRLFANDVTDGLTSAEADALTEADMVEASFTGYTAKTLTGGSWTVASRVATYTKQGFASTANQTAQSVYGYYVTRDSDDIMLFYEYFAETQSVSGSGQTIAVTPKITLGEDYGS